MGTLSKVRDNSQKIIWAFLITFILSMVAGGLMGGFNLVGQFKEWIGFNTSDQHAFSIDDERITHQSYASQYDFNTEQLYGQFTEDIVNIPAHIATLNTFKDREATNKLYEDVFNSNKVTDVDILTSITPNTSLIEDVTLNKIFLKGFSEQFKDANSNGLWDDAEDFLDKKNNTWDEGEEFTDTNGNDKWDEGEEFTDAGNKILDDGEFIPEAHDKNNNGKWDDAEKFTDIKNGKYDEGEEFIDIKNGKWDEGEEFTDILNFKYDDGEKFTDTNGNGKWDEGEEFTDAGNADGVWQEGEGFIDGNFKYDKGEEFTDVKNGKWDANTQKWIDQCIQDGKIDYSVIEDPYFRQIVKNRLNPSGQNYKLNKLNSVNASLNYKTNHEIQFDHDLDSTKITIDYLKYDLSEIDDEVIKIDEQELTSKITPFKKYNSGFSNVTLIIITVLFLIYSYINRENRARLSFGGFFFVTMFLVTIFKFLDYNSQGSDSLRKISYVHITKLPGNDKWDEGEEFTDTNGNGKYDEGEKFTDTLNGIYNEGEEFTDTNGNDKWDEGEEFADAAGLDINKAKNEIVKGITKDGLDIKYLEDNDLKKGFYDDINIVKNFVTDTNINNISQFNLLSQVINKTFEVDLGSHFIIEDKSGTDINSFIIGYVHSEENYYKHLEYNELKNEFIKNEKQKIVESKLKDLVNSAKDKDVLAIDIPKLFKEYEEENEAGNDKWDEGEEFTDTNGNDKWDEGEEFTDTLKEFISAGTTNGTLNKVVESTFKSDPSVIGTLYAMNTGEASNIVFSNDGFAYVFFMQEKDTSESKIDYEGDRQKQNFRQRIQSNGYFADMLSSLNVLDWRNEASITVTVDPDTRATKNLSNLYFDYNSYLQLKNTLFNR